MTSGYVPPNQYSGSEIPGLNDQNNIQSHIKNLQKALKSNPKYVYCPFCNKSGVTKVEQSCNIWTGVLSIVGVVIIWMGVQYCRDKDINCRDADHYCVSCGNKLVSYKST